MARKTIKVDALARVEGEGGIRVTLHDGAVRDVALHIFEPPRFFEGFLRGRDHTEAPDITARICGICPVAYQMSAVQAMEDALGVTIPAPIRDLRRLLYCGEWIESHTLHIHMLHAPDFLGYDSAIDMARDHAEAVNRGLAVKKAGNDLVRLLGGREIHPINVRVGGFYRVPRRRDLLGVVETLQRARDDAAVALQWVAGFEFPDCERDYEFVALGKAGEYPFTAGHIVSNRGIDAPPAEFNALFEETHVRHSTALHARVRARGAYLTGPLARYSLNADLLSPLARDAAKEAGLGATCTNPFRSIVVRAVEVLFACDEALRLIDAYQEPDHPAVAITPRAGTGHACTEAPRGMLYHRYRLDAEGTIIEARIVPPTSQNQASIEQDLKSFIPSWIELPEAALTERCEHAVRNHDPCISCSTHFLRLEIAEG